MNKILPEVQIYSDWGANPNPGPGAYGVIMKYWNHQKDFSQGYKMTTNNRMELLWAITGLQKLKTRSRVVLTTDSRYTINGIEKWWAKKWKANNWFRTGTQKAQNWDLWEILLREVEKHDVKFEWIKWHTGHIENELCDQLATHAMKRDDLLIDEWYIEAFNSLPFQGKGVIKIDSDAEKTGTQCKKCNHELIKKYPKHTKKTLEKQYYYEYYYHCESCRTNYMLEEAKRDIKTLKI